MVTDSSAAKTAARSASLFTGRSSPLLSCRTETSLLTATTSDAPSARALCKVGHMAAMQDIEYAIGQHDRARKSRYRSCEAICCHYFSLEIDRGHGALASKLTASWNSRLVAACCKLLNSAIESPAISGGGGRERSISPQQIAQRHAGRSRGLQIGCSIAEHRTARQIEVELACSTQQHAGRRFATVTLTSIVTECFRWMMRTIKNAIDMDQVLFERSIHPSR